MTSPLAEWTMPSSRLIRSIRTLSTALGLSLLAAWPGIAHATTVCATTPCLGQDVNLRASGVTGATFLWKSFTDSAQALARNPDGTFGNPAFRHPNGFTSTIQAPSFQTVMNRLPQLLDEGWYAVTVSASGLSTVAV